MPAIIMEVDGFENRAPDHFRLMDTTAAQKRQTDKCAFPAGIGRNKTADDFV
jgi:hypothetical protein